MWKNIWNIDTKKIRVLLLFQIATRYILNQSIWNWDSDSTLERTFLYGNRYFKLAHLACLPYENERIAFISDRYTTNFTEPLFETDI